MPASVIPQQRLQLTLAEKEQPPAPIQVRFEFAPDKPETGRPGKAAGDLLTLGDSANMQIIVSVGTAEKANAEALRKAGGALGKWLIASPITEADLDLGPIDKLGVPGGTAALLEGLRLGAYRFTLYKKTDEENKPVIVFLRGKPATGTSADLLNRVQILTDAVILAREWSHEPANVINPVSLADRAFKLAKQTGLKCTILDEKALAALNAGAILAVGVGSQTPSRLIVLEYPGHKAPADAKPVVLVGKALTFDTGGYSLKDTTNIQGMKYDKCGGLNVLAALYAAALLKVKVPVIGVIGAAENMISSRAYRPDDIITTLSGKTVEIVSTDAEGRLVLADSLTYAQKNFQPRAIVDLATLTGGVVVALGRIRAGLFSNSEELARQLFDAGEKTGERLWQLPLDDEYLQATKGDDADLKNSGGREGHAILGAIFLKQFIENDTPWAHLDIAGLADSQKDLPYCQKGGTGFGVRLLLEYLETLA